jgi:hypothetical protein
MSIPIYEIYRSPYNIFVATKTSALLLEHFLKWQSLLGERKTLKEFADYIGISDKSFNLVFTGRREPTEKQTQLFATTLRDNKFYEITGRIPADHLLIYVNRHWDEIDLETKKRIAEEVAQYTAEPLPEDDGAHTTNS